jgi:hypothetical protein
VIAAAWKKDEVTNRLEALLIKETKKHGRRLTPCTKET